MKRVKASFYSGLLTVLPVVITIYIFDWFFQMFIRLLQNSFVTAGIKVLVLKLGQEKDIDLYTNIFINTLSFITVIIFLILLGAVMRIFIFKKVGAFIDRILIKIPLFSQIYSTINQIISLVVSDREKAYQKVVLLEYPRKGIYSVGFLTSEGNYLVERETKEEMCNIFIPTSPNPTSGMFVVVKKSEVRGLDIKVDDAIKLIISGGVILPNEKG